MTASLGDPFGKFSCLDLPSGEPVGNGGATRLEVTQAASAGLDAVGSVALGFESPMMVPVPSAGAEGWPASGRHSPAQTRY